MSEFRRIMMSSFLMLLLHFPAAAGQLSSFTFRVGDEVTLPFDNWIDDQNKCESTTWLFIDSSYSTTVELVLRGQIGTHITHMII
ncbi:Amylosucrase [Dissostichus eleginoides]|uniref:Amylosucrase n=1 Tax=Dissostichus eleginoides TaxID=100907 RepID=A0AAD9F4B1_DISEL|nr:Amylosucrase [Dissostichus eleginoides]